MTDPGKSRSFGWTPLVWALLAAALLGGCGGRAPTLEGQRGDASPSASATLASADASAAAEQAAADYLTARSQALIPGSAAALEACLLSRSPASAVEPAVAEGRLSLFAEQGLEVVAATTSVDPGSARPSFYRGSEPIAAGAVSSPEPGLVRAVVFATVTTVFSLSDGRELTETSEHVLTLVLSTGRWRVFRDRYLDAWQAEWLRAGGASDVQVAASRARWAGYLRSCRVASTPQAAVRAFVGLLGAGRYEEADLYLGFAACATAEGMAATLQRIRLVSARTQNGHRQGTVTVAAALQVEPRLALWNEGINVRFFSLQRQARGAWRIVGISSGP